MVVEWQRVAPNRRVSGIIGPAAAAYCSNSGTGSRLPGSDKPGDTQAEPFSQEHAGWGRLHVRDWRSRLGVLRRIAPVVATPNFGTWGCEARDPSRSAL